MPGGQVLQVPPGWVLLPPGDAGLTRRVKAAGPTWTVPEKRGRKMFSRGIWAARAHIEPPARSSRPSAPPRRTPKKLRRRTRPAARASRPSTWTEFAGRAALPRLRARHTAPADRLAEAVTAHATPVGSGTVARTERIPVERTRRGRRHRLAAPPDDARTTT